MRQTQIAESLSVLSALLMMYSTLMGLSKDQWMAPRLKPALGRRKQDAAHVNALPRPAASPAVMLVRQLSTPLLLLDSQVLLLGHNS